MTSFNVTGSDTTAKSLTEGNAGADDTGTVTSTGSLAVASGAVVSVALTNPPAGAGVVITNAGTMSSGSATQTGGRTIDTGSAAIAVGTSAANGAKLTIKNSGTITNPGGTSGNDDAIRINNDMVYGTFLLYNTGSITTAGQVNDSVGVRLGKVYSAYAITINNGIDASGAVNTAATISTADADAIRPGGVNPTNSASAFGSSTINNYGTISAKLSVTTASPTKDNAIDIGGGQAATVNNYGTIVGDESGLGADNGAGGASFAPTYYVTNYAGATITGNNGPAIAIGSNSAPTGPSTTSTITNLGTITGNASGIGNGKSGITVANANGTGIFSAYAVTIVNGSASSAAAIIQGTGFKGSPTVGQQQQTGATTYYAINASSGSVANYGTIRETNATAAGAAINFYGSANSVVTNYGTGSIIGANGAAIQMGSGNDTVNLYTGGTITGTIDGGTGTNTLGLFAGAGTTSGTFGGVTNFQALQVNSGAWTLADAETYSGGVTIASGANLVIGPNGSTNAAITDNGTLTYLETGTFTKTQAITGTGKLVQAGTGTLVLTNANNTYSGGTVLQSGILDVTAAGAAGTAAIAFGTTAGETLDIEQSALSANGSFGNTLSGVAAGDTIDLRGIGTATGTSFNASTNQLTVSGGSQTVVLQLDGSSAPPSGYAYGVSSDGAGGTNVALDQVATVTNLTASPSSGYVKAGGTITFTITTSKAVSVSGAAPVLNLSNGGTATYDSVHSTATSLVFTTTVASGQDSNGVTITSVTNAGDVQDAYDVPLDFSGAAGHAAVGPTIDTTAPTVAITSMGGLTNQATQTISGTVDASTSGTPDNGTVVSIYEQVGASSNLLGTATVSNGTWSTSVNLAGNGNHTIYAQDTDAAGNTGTSGSVTYDLETTAPPVTISSSGGLTNQRAQTVVGQVDVNTDPEAVGTTITVTDTGTSQVLGTGIVGNDGAFSVNVTLTGDGQHTLQASDTDRAGNVGYANVSYTLDTTPPAAPSLALTNDTGTSQTDKITSDPTITYTPSASGDTLLYSLDGSFYSTNAPTLRTDGSQDGQHTVSVEEKDPAGNISSAASLTFTLDTTAPTTAPTVALAHDTGSSSTDGVTNDPTINASVGTSGDTLLYKTDGATTYTTTAPTFKTDGTQDGAHTVVVAEEDAAGNVGPSTTLNFTLDTTPPAAPSLALANDTGNSHTDKITSDPTITYTPSAGGDTLLYKADGATSYSSTAPTFATDGSQDGSHTVSVEEVDKAGNVSAPASLTFTLDTTPPDVDFTSPGGSVNSATQTINGTAGAENVGTTVSIYEDGGTTAIGTAVVNAGGHFSATVNLGADGTHTLTASDTDKAGNVGTTDEPVTFTVDSTAPTFTPGNLVISISGDGDGSGDYGDNQATPLVLQQITTDGTFVNQIVLPQTTTTNANGVTESAVSAEYGSSSEGSLQLSADGHSLVIAGYGVNANTYNAGGAAVYGNAALAQSTSIKGGTYTAVPRVIADINANGTIDSSTVLYNVFNTNNPRSVATIDGSSFYISGQGVKGDTTQGLYLVQDGGTTATPIDQTTDTRTAIIYNGQLYVSRDSKQGSGGTSNIAVYGPTLPTGRTTATILEAIDKSVVVTAATGNTVNGSSNGTSVNLDPENFFFADANTLYVADGGIPKQGGVGDGGLQKWVYNGTQWHLAYTLSAGLGIAAPGADEGTTGLIGLTGRVVGNTVELYATNQTVGDTDQKYVFGITDQLNATTNAGQSFTTLVTAAPDTNIRGIAFAPTPITPTLALAHDTGVSSTDHITSDPAITYTKAEAADTLLYSVNGSAYSTTAPTFAQDGTYTVSAEEKDKGGNVGPASSLTFTLDTTKPATPAAPTLTAASDTGTSSSDGITSDATPTFTGTAEVGATVTLYDGGTAVGSAVAGSDGAYTITSSTLADGTHTLDVTATDAAGNVSTASAKTSVTIDTAKPATPAAPTLTAASDTGSSSSDGITSDATPTFTGTAEAGSTVTLYDDGTAVGSAVAGSDGAYTITSSTLADGTHSLDVTATDTAGNVSVASADTTITIDTTRPDTPDAPTLTAASDTGSSSSDGITSDTTPTFTGTAEAGSTVTLYDGTTAVGSAVAGSDGAYAITSSTLADGTHTLDVTATDAAGNVSTASATTSVTIDTTRPATPDAPTLTAASDTGSSSSDGITSDTTPTFTGTAEAGATVTLYDGTSAVGSAVAGSDGAYTITSSVLADGTHALDVTGTDAAGNVSATSATTSVTIDTMRPATPDAPTLTAASDTGSSSSDGITSDTTPTFTGTAEAGSTVTLYDGTTAVGSAVAGSDGAYTITSSALSDGTHTLDVTATDAAGNVSTASAGTKVTIDTMHPATPAAPMLTAASDTGSSSSDGITSDTTPTFTGTAQAGATVTLYDGSTDVGSAVAGSDGAYTITASTLADGTHTLDVTATDAAGNVSAPSATTSVTIDTARPATPDAPTLTAASDTGSSSSDGITADATPTFTGSAEAGATVTLYDGTTAVGSAVAGSDGAYSITALTLADGTHTLDVTATDAAGNVSLASATTSVTIDTVRPATPGAPTLTAASDTGSSSSDGITADATPTFTGTAEAGSTVTLYDGTTAVGSTVAGSNGAYTVTASTLADGTHLLDVTATDAAGNVSTASSRTKVTIDTSRPATPAAPTLTAASDTGSSSSDRITADSTPTFTGTAEAGSTVTLYDGTTAVGSAVAGSDGAYTITASTLADGTHTLDVTATDTAGNVSVASTTTSVTIDTTRPATPPAPTLTAASDTGTSSSDGITADATPTFTGSAEAGATVTLYDGTKVVGSTVAGSNGAYTVTSSTLDQGTHNLDVTATDAAGNVSAPSATTSVTIVAPPPTPAAPTLTAASDTGASSSDRITADATPTFTGTVEAGSTVTLYDGTTAVGATVAGSNGTYTVTSSTLSDGTHAFDVTVTDAAGNVSAPSATTSVTIDTTRPTPPGAPTLTAASDTGTSSSDGITADATPTFTGAAEAGSTVTLYDGTTAVGSAVAGSNGAYTITASTLADGTHTLDVTATDKAGNVSTPSATTSVTIDTTRPATPAAPTLTAASDTGASSSDRITADSTPTFTGTAEAGSMVTLYDGTTAVGSTVAGSNGAYTVTASTLADGTHSLDVTATDKAGNVSGTSAATTVTIDTTIATPAAPTLTAASDTGSSSSDRITADATPTFTGSAEAGATVTLYDGTTAVGSTVAGSNGAYTVTAATLADGTHTLDVTATDKAGNVSRPSAGTVVTIDTTAPAGPAAPSLAAASDTGSSSSDGITADSTPTFTGTAEAGATVTLYDGSTAVGSTVAGSNGAYAVTASMLADGTHTLDVTATDAAGNVSAASATTRVTIDTTRPATPAAPTLTAASDTGSSSSDGITADATPTFTGTAEAGSTVTLYDGSRAVGSTVAGSNGAYTVTSSTLADGTHSLDVTATDTAGNVSAASASTSVTVDTTAPTPSAPVLAAGSDTGSSSSDGITRDATPTFTGTAEAGATVTLYDGTMAVGSTIVGSNGVYSVTASTLTDGTHTLDVTARDVAGNVGTSATTHVTIDTIAPATPAAPTFAGPSSNGVTNDATPTFTGTAEAGSTVTLYDGPQAIGSAVAGSNGAYSITAAPRANGTHTVVVTATDVAGNVSGPSAGTTLTIDTSQLGAPTLTAASDTGASSSDGITNDATPTFTGTASAGSTVTLYDGTTAVGSAVANANGVYRVTASPLADGLHTLDVTATDKAGNVSSPSADTNVTIDTLAPARPAAPTLTAASDSGASPSDGITNDAVPTFTGTAEAGATVTLYIGARAVGSAVAGSDGTYTVTASPLADGRHTLAVTATDVAGNVSRRSTGTAVTIDTTPPPRPAAPKLTAASDTGARDGITADATPTFTGHAQAGATVTLYDGTTVVGSAVAGANGAYRVDASTLADGTHALKVTATDAAGNVSRPSAGTAVTIETMAPPAPAAPALTAASDSGASSSDGITNDRTPTFTGTVEAGDRVTLYDGTTKVGSAVAKADGTYRVTASRLADGTHTLDVTATNKVGAVSPASAGTNVTIDTTRPVATLDGGGGQATSPDQLISGTGEPSSTVKVIDNGKLVGTTTVASNGGWSATIGLSTGANTIVARDVDAAGNVGTSRHVAYHYNSADAAQMASLNSMVQAMSTMTSSSSASMNPTAAAASQEAHPLAAAH